MASYRWAETPLRQSAAWQRLPRGLTIGLLVGFSVAGALLVPKVFARRTIWSRSTVMRHATDWYANHDDPTLQSPAGCRTGPHYRQIDGDVMVIEHRPCTLPSGGADKRLFVLGDSHAAAYLPLLHRLSLEESVSVSVYQNPGCPFLDLKVPMGEFRPSACISGSRAAVADLLTEAKQGDVVFLPSLRLDRFVDQWIAYDWATVVESQNGAGSVPNRERALRDATVWLMPLIDRGLSIVVEAPTPIFRAPAFRCADPWTRVNRICAKGLTEKRSDEMAYRQPALDAVERLVKETPKASVFDPLPVLCPGTTCSAVAANGRPLFFDADHLSRYGNEVLYPAFLAHWRRLEGAG